MNAAPHAAGPDVEVRADVLRDSRLSFRARGVYLFLAALPPGAEPTPRWIASQRPGGGVDAIRTALAELEAYGYIEPTGLPNVRVSIPLGLRYKTLRRDGYACRYCGARAPAAVLVADHVTPVAMGGETVLENLITACDPCNAGKGDTAPEPWLVEEVRRATSDWLASGDGDDDGEADRARAKGRGHVAVRIRR